MLGGGEGRVNQTFCNLATFSNKMVIRYFRLQFRLLNRQFNEAGVPAFLWPPAAVAIYVALYFVMKQYPTWGTYAVVLSNFQYLFLLSDFKRNDFLKANCSTGHYYAIRILENLLVSLGTLALCLLLGHYLLGGFLLVFGAVFLFLPTAAIWRRSMPTPFARKPFEFSIGFRKTWLLLLLLYAIGFVGLGVGNINLALFGLFCICGCSALYYQEPEPLLMHWNQNRRPLPFLRYKMWRGMVQLSMLLTPLLLGLALFHPAELYKGAIVWGLGLFLVPFMVCLKYAVRPRRFNATEATMVALCVTFYPLILAIIPYYYFKAVANLKRLP